MPDKSRIGKTKPRRVPTLAARLGAGRDNALFKLVGERRYRELDDFYRAKINKSETQLKSRHAKRLDAVIRKEGLTPDEAERIRFKVPSGARRPGEILAFPRRDKSGRVRWTIEVGGEVRNRGLSTKKKDQIQKSLRYHDRIRREMRTLGMTRPEVLALNRQVADNARRLADEAKRDLKQRIAREKDPEKRRFLRRSLKRVNVAKRVRGATYALAKLAYILESE